MGKPGSLTKLLTDYSIAFVALLVASPILLLAAAAIKLDSTGPVFFRQLRVGRHRKPFYVYKLRTMTRDAESSGPKLTQKNDARITRVGRFLRRSSIDELPQLINVLRGEMSLVGPRPEVVAIAADYPEELEKVFDWKPGITGISQVSGRASLDPAKKVGMEIAYYSKATFLSDLAIAFKTPLAVLSGEGNIM